MSELRVLRRDVNGEKFYFILNHGDKRFDEDVEITGQWAPSAVLMDPMTGKTGLLQIGKPLTAKSGVKLRLQLEPRHVLILHTLKQEVATGTPWRFPQATGLRTELKGTWQAEFLQGGPDLPPGFKTEQLASWTTGGGERAQSFAGTARYSLRFDAPLPAEKLYSLDMGDVRHSARVKLNGNDLGIVFTKPFRVSVEGLQPRGNLLEIEVTGTSANRIRDMDVKKLQWKIFYDTNIVTLNYKSFDASKWPVAEQGLLGPVTLQAERASH